MTSPLTPQDCVSEFIRRLTALDREKSPYDKFREFCEMVFCAKAKRVALTRERADELEDRYMQIVVVCARPVPVRRALLDRRQQERWRFSPSPLWLPAMSDADSYTVVRTR
jgi:hypothetical protein